MSMLPFIENVINLRRADYLRDSLLAAVRGKCAYRRLLRDVMLLALTTGEVGLQSTREVGLQPTGEVGIQSTGEVGLSQQGKWVSSQQGKWVSSQQGKWVSSPGMWAAPVARKGNNLP